MHELFGIPMDVLLIILLVGLGAALGLTAGLAVRNPILVKLGTRNVGRRRGRSALIVVGLMLGTTIIAAALATGDTMSHTIRQTAVRSLGNTDEVVSAKGATDDIAGELGQATGVRYFPADTVQRVERSVRGTGLVDGVTGAIVMQVAMQAPAARQTEPSVTLFAPDPGRMAGFSEIRSDATGDALSLRSIRPGEVYLNARAADRLHVSRGDTVTVFAQGAPMSVRVRDVVRFDGAATADAAVLMPLASAQAMLQRPGQVAAVLVSNRGGALSGGGRSDEVRSVLRRAVAGSGLEVATVKQDAIEQADQIGNGFMTMFTTFGSFSIAAGILLIFLIFVMLAAERRGELGIARAVGTRRGHLVEMFVFEGVAYDLIAALVGALLGAAVAYGMVLAMARALGAEDADAGLRVQYAVTPQSLAVGFSLGVLLTLLVVAFSAWRVSMMTISSAIRNLPEPGRLRRRRGILLGLAGLAAGALMVAGSGSSATVNLLGVSLVLISPIPLLRRIGVSERLSFTICGLALVVFLLLPWSVVDDVFGQKSMDFTTWIASGLMIIVGTVWVIMYNADVLGSLLQTTLGRLGALAPVLRVSMAYPLASRFRTGTTLAMFTLVVFTLVTGSVTSGSFMHAALDERTFGGGFDVRAGTSGTAAIHDMRSAVDRSATLRAADYPVVASQSVLAVSARQPGAGRGAEDYLVRGLDRSFIDHTTFGLGAMAAGYSTARQVWDAMRDRPGLAVVDTTIVPRRDNFGFNAAPPDLQLTGLYVDENGFRPLPLVVTDAQTGRRIRLTVIGILKDSAPLEMAGITTSQRTLDAAFPGRVRPTIHYFRVAPGVNAEDAAARLESAFLANGLEAQSIHDVVHDATAASLVFNRLILAFMGLGLVVGVAALGVISARSVVERRQQIGVLRAIGFRRGMVQAAFLLESSLIAVSSILFGTLLGLVLAYNIISDQQRMPSWSNVTMQVPWWNLALVFVLVFAVSLGATLLPARRASRVRPAEALRYE